MPVNVEKTRNRPYLGGSLFAYVIIGFVKTHYYNNNILSSPDLEK